MSEQNGRTMISKIKSSWRKAGEADARACIERFPEIARHKSWAIDLAYEEFCVKEAAGQDLDVKQFCDGFPAIRHSLARQLEVHQYVQENPDFLGQDIDWPERGDEFYGYLILDRLGSGALAHVYLCSQPELGDRQVVVKFAMQGGYEALTLGRLTHPNIMPIYSAEEDAESGVSQICMPFCGRSTLYDVLDGAFAEGNVPERADVILTAANARCQPDDRYDRLERPDRRFRSASYVDGILIVIEQLADALAHAHQHGVLHGDIKPSNVLIAPNGRPMLLDFNLAHDRRRPAAMTGGTLPYMAPEQIRAAVLREDVEVDERADIYSLAVILHELLCGQLPFGPVTEPIASRELARQRLQSQSAPITPLSSRNPSIDAGLDQLIQRCLASDPAKRPQTMEELSQELSRQLRHTRRTVRWMHVNRRGVLVAATLLALASVGLVAAHNAMPERHYRHFQLGQKYFHDGRFEEAIEVLTKAVEAVPKNVDYRNARGRAYIELADVDSENWRKAQDDFQIGRGRSNGSSIAYYGYCLQQQGGGRSAIAEYLRALKLLDKPTVGILNNLGYELVRNDVTRSQIKQALSVLFRAYRLDRGSTVVVCNILYAIRRKVRTDAAIFITGEATMSAYELQIVNVAFENRTKNAEVNCDLAMILAATLAHYENNLNRAIDCFERAAQFGMSLTEMRSLRFSLPQSLREDARFVKLLANWPDEPFGRPPQRLLDPFANPLRSETVTAHR